MDASQSVSDRKTIELFHDLKVHIFGPYNSGTSPVPAGPVSAGKTAAVWDQGFQSFLKHPDELAAVLKIVAPPPAPLGCFDRLKACVRRITG